MAKGLQLTPGEQDTLTLLAQRIKRARLRRNLPQAAMARAANISIDALAALEAGRGGTSVAVLLKVLSVLDMAERLARLVEDDRVGEALEAETGRKRARSNREQPI